MLVSELKWLQLIILINFSSLTFFGCIKHVLPSCFHIRDVPLNKTTQQPLFKDYPKDMTTHNTGQGEPPNKKTGSTAK